jgi:hypothetical protein
MKDRFELETNISQFLNFSDQVRLVNNYIYEDKLNKDQIFNALEGIAVLIELHQEKTFDSFKQAFKLDEYNKRVI